jgi:pimeloyl-ACP methyl ester carboxylesterase
MVGASLGGRLVLEMARLGLAGNVAALNPGGFWAGWERTYLQTTLLSSAFLLRSIGPLRGALATNFATRSLVMAQLSAHPWKLEADLVAAELDSIANTRIFNELVTDVATIPAQNGPAGAPTGRVAIGWGRHDRLCWPVQAERAAAAFPSARLHWFEHSGHYSWWDEPDAVARVIAETVGD